MPTDALISLPGFDLLSAHLENGCCHASLASTGLSGRCPACGSKSASVHSRYVRTIADLPVVGKAVVLELHVQRFRRRDPGCPRRIFCERFDDLGRHARRTERQRAALGDLGVELGVRAGVRAASKLGLNAGRTALLNAVRAVPLPEPVKPKVIGVDDFAFKRGHTYGTVIVNLETHGVLDLLPDRKPDTLAAWLKAHKGVKIVTRDRSKEYAQGISQGAPHARQVVDRLLLTRQHLTGCSRWHLLKNLRQALQRVVDANQNLVAPILKGVRSAVKLPRSSRKNQSRNAARQRRRLRLERVREAFAEIGSINGTAKREQPVRCCLVSKKKLGVSHWLVRQSLKPGEPPHRQFNKSMSSKLDPFESHLFAWFVGGCRSVSTLWIEIKEQGFVGSRKAVQRWMQRQRLAAKAAPSRKAVKRPDQASGARNLSWLLREDADLSSEELEAIEGLKRGCPVIVQARDLALQFVGGLRDRQPKVLVAWVLEARASGIPALKEFAVGLEQELSAIKSAFSLEWSKREQPVRCCLVSKNGPVEGVVNRIKLIKRQMFGRASFDLLRRRVLLAA